MIPAFFLFALAVAWRVISGFTHGEDFGWLHNFAPLSATALCGAIFLPRRLAFALPLGALLVSDLVLNAHYGVALINVEMLLRYVALAMIAAGGLALRPRPQAGLVLGASVAGSVAFYLISNTGSWLAEPRYVKSAAGWLQALTTGLPGYPETWMFYRHTLASDLFFTGLMLVCFALARRAPEAARTVSA